jgi:hypothetical protein
LALLANIRLGWKGLLRISVNYGRKKFYNTGPRQGFSAQLIFFGSKAGALVSGTSFKKLVALPANVILG